MFEKQGKPVRCPNRPSGRSQRPISPPVPASGGPSFPSSQPAPRGIPVITSRMSRPAGPDERRGARSFRPLLVPVLAVAVLVLQAAATEAACGKKHRVSHRDSECLSAWWENHNSTFRHNTYNVRNNCASQGRVVAKVDLKEEMDRTLYLDNGATRSGQTKFRIRWIYCCSDLSTLCNRSDLERAEDGAGAPGAMVTGTASGSDTLASAWLSGFGRAVASEQVDLLGARLAAGSRQPHLTLGGYEPDLPGLSEGEPGEGATRPMAGRDLLSGSSFLFTGGGDASGRWSGWGSAAPLGFAGAHGSPGEGRLELLGTDYSHGRLLAGVALSHASGADGPMPDGVHRFGASLRGVHPYLRLAVDDRLWIWSAFGFWTGDMMLRESDGATRPGPPGRWRTGLDMAMAAAGAGGALLTADEADGFAVAAKADAYAMRIGSGAFTLPEAGLDRQRLGLDGSRVFRLGSRRSLAASIGLGLLRDGGDGGAETSGGLNASLRHASPGQSIVARLGHVGGGREYTLGWRMEPALHAAPRFGLGLRVARREHTDDDRETEHAIDLRVTVAW